MEHQSKDSLATQSNIYFCEQPRVTETDRPGLPGWKKEAIRRLQTIDEGRNMRLLAMIAMWIFSGVAVAIADSPVVSVLACFTMGVAIMGISVFMHEASHHLMFKNHSLNRMVGFLCGAPALISVSAYRTVQMLHHAHERTEKDPDARRSASHNVQK
jgi:fatty acid desaturase